MHVACFIKTTRGLWSLNPIYVVKYSSFAFFSHLKIKKTILSLWLWKSVACQRQRPYWFLYLSRTRGLSSPGNSLTKSWEHCSDWRWGQTVLWFHHPPFPVPSISGTRAWERELTSWGPTYLRKFLIIPFYFIPLDFFGRKT